MATERIDRVEPDSRIIEGRERSLRAQRGQCAVWVATELDHSGADHIDMAHGCVSTGRKL